MARAQMSITHGAQFGRLNSAVLLSDRATGVEVATPGWIGRAGNFPGQRHGYCSLARVGQGH